MIHKIKINKYGIESIVPERLNGKKGLHIRDDVSGELFFLRVGKDLEKSPIVAVRVVRRPHGLIIEKKIKKNAEKLKDSLTLQAFI